MTGVTGKVVMVYLACVWCSAFAWAPLRCGSPPASTHAVEPSAESPPRTRGAQAIELSTAQGGVRMCGASGCRTAAVQTIQPAGARRHGAPRRTPEGLSRAHWCRRRRARRTVRAPSWAWLPGVVPLPWNGTDASAARVRKKCLPLAWRSLRWSVVCGHRHGRCAGSGPRRSGVGLWPWCGVLVAQKGERKMGSRVVAVAQPGGAPHWVG